MTVEPGHPTHAEHTSLDDSPRTERLQWPGGSWHPLFYDLAFVAVVLALSGALSYSTTPATAAWLSLAFVALWISWVIGVLLEPVRPVGMLRVVVVTAQMILLVVAAIAADDSTEDNTRVVGIAIGVAVALPVLLLRRKTGWVSGRAAAALVTAGLLWVVSVPLWDYWLVLGVWAAALVAMAAAVIWLMPRQLDDPHRLGHRLGELTVIVLGEGFLKIALEASVTPLSELSLLAVFVAFTLATLLWWAYFTIPGPGHAETFTRVRALAWLAGHALTYLGLMGLAVGLAKLLVYGGDLESTYTAWLLALPLALVVFGFAATRTAAGSRGMDAAGAWLVVTAVAFLGLSLVVWLTDAPGPILTTALLTIGVGAAAVRQAWIPTAPTAADQTVAR